MNLRDDGGISWGESGDGATMSWFPERDYNSTQARWMTPDPAGMAAVDPSNPQTWNRYTYVLNDPLSATDPDGLFCVWDDGSYDSNNDAYTGSSEACQGDGNGNNGAGGTWFNGSPSDWSPGAGDWSGQANQQFAAWAQGINPSVGDWGTATGTPDASAFGTFSLIATIASQVGAGVIPPATPCTSRSGRAYGPGHYARDYHLSGYGAAIPAPENGTITGGRSGAAHIPGPYNYSQLAPPGSANFTQFSAESGYVLSYVHVHPAGPIGTSVQQGGTLGVSDNSGRITGPHTHVQVTDPNGSRIDPNSYFSQCQ